MKELPHEKTLAELVELAKDFEDQCRKLYEMSEAFAQKYEKRIHEAKLQHGDSRIVADDLSTINQDR